MSDQFVGVIGSGSFGTAVANLLAENGDVLMYARREEIVDEINSQNRSEGIPLNEKIRATNSIQELCEKCLLLFPTIPSSSFREVMKQCAPFLQPDHIMIHTTKGLDLLKEIDIKSEIKTDIDRDDICTMSRVIRDETVVIRVGCLSGPNLAGEINDGQPAAATIASQFDEVINQGRKAIRSHRFQVYGSHNLIGVEIAGVLKNAMAIAAGALSGMGYGENVKAFLITKGLSEMIRLAKKLGGDVDAFLGLAGIGDLVATCSSSHSRNFTVGFRLAKGESLQQILDTTTEVAEGVKTVLIANALADHYKIRVPIIHTLHEILYKGVTPQEGLKYLMLHPFDVDVDYL